MARREGEPVVGGVVEHRRTRRPHGVPAGAALDPDPVGWRHHLVDEPALVGVDLDPVARDQLVDAVERSAVGGAVARDGGVSGLAWQGGPDVVAGAFLQVGLGRSLDEELLHADLRDLDHTPGAALGRCRRGGRRRPVDRGQRGRHRGGIVVRRSPGRRLRVHEGRTDLGLARGLLEPGSPQLEADEQEQQHAGSDEDAPEGAKDSGHCFTVAAVAGIGAAPPRSRIVAGDPASVA